MKKKIILILVLTVLFFSCYIDGNGEDSSIGNTKVSVKLPISYINKAAAGTSVFDITMTKEDDSEVVKTITIDNENIFSNTAGNGDLTDFYLLNITDIDPGNYISILIHYDAWWLGDNSDYYFFTNKPFTIIENSINPIILYIQPM